MATNVIVLGGSGMLGSMVTDFLSRERSLTVTATVRDEGLIPALAERAENVTWRVFDAAAYDPWNALSVIEGFDWVVNAIGITKPLIHDDNAAEIERAIAVNAELPHLIARRAELAGARVVQIATDCVYSGAAGPYRETDAHDALDVYGKTKSLGEVRSPSVFHLRCSIVGPEPKDHKFLLDWFTGQPAGAELKGFTNHRWNGVTTLQFAKLCCGVFVADLDLPPLHHAVPGGDITKDELLRVFAAEYERDDIAIEALEAPAVVDRRLATCDTAFNEKLWAAAGYNGPPSVATMVGEVARHDYRFRDVVDVGAVAAAHGRV